MPRIWLLGTGASEGVPVYGCSCPACMEARRDPRYRRKPTALLISSGDEAIVIDMGYDVMELIDESGLEVKAVLLTHWHHDHFAGLYRFRWSRRRIPLYAPLGGADPEITRNPISLKPAPVEAWRAVRIGRFTATPVPLIHGIETYGYLVSVDDTNIAVLQDTKGLPGETLRFLGSRKIHAAIIDATYAPGVDGEGHNNVDEAIRIGRLISAEKIILSHIAHHNLPYTQLRGYAEEKGRNIMVPLDNTVVEA